MATASVEVSGPNAERLAGELQAALVAAIQPGDDVSPVEVERSADLVIAIIGLVFSGVGTAKTIWDEALVNRLIALQDRLEQQTRVRYGLS